MPLRHAIVNRLILKQHHKKMNCLYNIRFSSASYSRLPLCRHHAMDTLSALIALYRGIFYFSPNMHWKNNSRDADNAIAILTTKIDATVSQLSNDLGNMPWTEEFAVRSWKCEWLCWVKNKCIFPGSRHQPMYSMYSKCHIRGYDPISSFYPSSDCLQSVIEVSSDIVIISEEAPICSLITNMAHSKDANIQQRMQISTRKSDWAPIHLNFDYLH